MTKKQTVLQQNCQSANQKLSSLRKAYEMLEKQFMELNDDYNYLYQHTDSTKKNMLNMLSKWPDFDGEADVKQPTDSATKKEDAKKLVKTEVQAHRKQVTTDQQKTIDVINQAFAKSNKV